MPLTLLASANALIGVIQQGCEMYTEYKGTVAKAKQTYEQVMENVNEVKNFWTFLKDKFFNRSDPVQKVIEKQATQIAEQVSKQQEEPLEKDEFSVYADIAKSLVKYFHLIERIQEKLREAEEQSRDISKKQNTMELSLNRVLIHEQLIKMSENLRTVMCWNTPKELGALYQKVTEMREIVLQEQEEVRQQQINEQRMREWRITQFKHQVIDDILAMVGALAISAIVWSHWMVLKSHQ